MAELKYLGYKFEILGHPWTVYFYKKGPFKKKYSAETYGVTECDDKEIFLRVDRLKRDTVIHELTHAYFWEMGASVAGLDVYQMEEMACELVAKYGERVMKTADEILLAYKIVKTKVDQKD